ncbi:hypothetical protein NDU88_002628 [Pleurodeles waltl]|uniref:Uncharacterized protein n=1 Tax=Pleurodeles waltl TaxID=8319 RepID=A0AAV7P7B0_PLEWA|nr:hypothetical protein NDU88_002628 [Pleurodeles waltl]
MRPTPSLAEKTHRVTRSTSTPLSDCLRDNMIGNTLVPALQKFDNPFKYRFSLAIEVTCQSLPSGGNRGFRNDGPVLDGREA